MFVTSHVLLLLVFGTLSLVCYVHSVELLPLGNQSIFIEDELLQEIKLSRPLEFFEKKYNQLLVSDDGIIVFDEDIKGQTNKPKKFPYEYSVIAPLWHDFDGVKLYYREITPDNSPRDLETASSLVKKTHPNLNHFQADWAMLFTWFNVSRYSDTDKKTHTFQALLVSNKNATFAIFLYGEVQNAGNAQVGVNAGHCQIYYTLCISLTEKTNDMMDVRTCDGDYGVVGFRLDSADRDQECSSQDLPASEIVASKNTTRVGSVLSYSCAKGYALIADDELACYYDGENAIWDGYINGCIKLPRWVSPTQNREYDFVTVRENARGGSLVYTLNARAGDGTANITYHFVKQIPSEPFSFDLYGDEVRLTPLPDLDVDDKRFPPTFILQFRAKDKRYSNFSDKISSDVYLIVNIADVNDNAPKFTKSEYTKTIQGNKKIGSYVLAVTATDDDASCPNNEVHYELVDESSPGYFSLDPFNGKIQLEKQPNDTMYELIVKATDAAMSGGSDTAGVTINVVNPVTTTTTTAAPEPVAMTTPASTGLSTAGVIGIMVAILIVAVAGVLVFFYRRHLQKSQPSVSATFKHGNTNVVLDNPNFIPNSSYIDDRSFSETVPENSTNTAEPRTDYDTHCDTQMLTHFSEPVPENSTNTAQPGTDYDTHCDTQVLTTDSWRKEQERARAQS